MTFFSAFRFSRILLFVMLVVALHTTASGQPNTTNLNVEANRILQVAQALLVYQQLLLEPAKKSSSTRGDLQSIEVATSLTLSSAREVAVNINYLHLGSWITEEPARIRANLLLYEQRQFSISTLQDHIKKIEFYSQFISEKSILAMLLSAKDSIQITLNLLNKPVEASPPKQR